MAEQRAAKGTGPGSPDELECLLDRFEVAWQGDLVPDIEDFLLPVPGPRRTADGPDPGELLQELIKIDLEYRWRRPGPGRISSLPARPRVEDYAERFPGLGPLHQLPVEFIGEEYRVRQRWGDRPGHAEYLDRFPQRGPALRQALVRIDAALAAEFAGGEPGPPNQSLAPLPPGSIHLRCPYCHQSLEIVVDALQRNCTCSACGGTFGVESMAPASWGAGPPTSHRLGRYELGDRLGTGAFGSVWQAWDTELAREVAVKVPRSGQLPSSGEEERFLREARSAAQLHHPGIVSVHDVGRDQGTLYIVSELVRGVSLAGWVKGGWPSFQETAGLVAQVADALDHAHRHGVVHRDVKPSNIMLECSEAPQGFGKGPPARAHAALPRPRIMDFGLALRDAGEVTMTLDGQILGTPAYMSPEQLRNPHAVDGRSDTYSLGVVLYELLTGELPFHGTTRMLLHQVMYDEPRPPRQLNDQIPRDLETVCLKCLDKEPGRRYKTAGLLAADLRRSLAGKRTLARPAGRVEKLWRWEKRHPALVVTACLVGVTLVALPAALALGALVAVTVGAVLFALHKTRAAAELVRDVEDGRRHQQKTAAALQFALKQTYQARQERDRASASEAQALRRFGLVRDLARTVIFDFPHHIREWPGPAPARVFFVETCLTYLDGLVNEAGDDAALQRELAIAYAKVGDVQGSPHQSNFGDAAGALASYRKSVNVFAALAKANPDNAQAQRDLAACQRKISDLQDGLAQTRGNDRETTGFQGSAG